MIVMGVAGVASHLKSKDFVKKRLRFTALVEKPGIGLMAGAATAIAMAPVVAILPILGAGTAIALGAGVGTGVHIGAKKAREGGPIDD